MKYPGKLDRGDTVGIICPSTNIDEERKQQCIETIKNMGYKVKAAGNITTDYGGYMAGDGRTRAKWINEMFADPEVKAIFCVRGGYAGSRAMEFVDFDLIKKNPKIFVGYSDVTSFHLGITQNCGFVTFHGPMVSSNMVDGFDSETEESFFEAINADSEYEFKNPKGYEIKVLQEGSAEGELTGGNLALLSACIGTPYEIDTKGKILFIEEVEETMSRIERFIYQLRASGKLQQCAGIIMGQFTDCTNPNMPGFTEIELFKDVLEGIDVPVLYNVQSGHGSPMMTLPFGGVCRIDTKNKSIRFAKPER